MKKSAQPEEKKLEEDDERKKLLAKIYTDSVVSSSLITTHINNTNHLLPEILDEMRMHLASLNVDDVKTMETILLPQAYALQAIFEKSATQMLNTENINVLQAWSVIALKAQEQCRKTLATIADIRHPKQTAFIKQQNNAINQQVNNSENIEKSKSSAHFSEKNLNPTNELLSEVHHETLDTGRTNATIQVNSSLEAVGAINGGKDIGRSGSKQSERL